MMHTVSPRWPLLYQTLMLPHGYTKGIQQIGSYVYAYVAGGGGYTRVLLTTADTHTD